MKRLFLAILVGLLISVFSLGVPSAEKLKFATAVPVPVYDLIFWAAEEKGFWKQNQLEVEWVPFKSGSVMYKAMAAKSVYIGMAQVLSALQAAAGGVSLMVIYGVSPYWNDFGLWVRADSPFRKPQDLKGTKIGLNRLGGANHAYGKMFANSLGLGKEIRFVSVGSTLEAIASLRAGHADAVVTTVDQVAKLLTAGVVRQLLSARDYLPKRWLDVGVFARKELVQSEPDLVRKALKGVAQATDFLTASPTWTMEKMKQQYGHSDKTAQEIYDSLSYIKGGKMEFEAVQNVLNFMIEYGIIGKERVPSLSEFYTDQFAK